MINKVHIFTCTGSKLMNHPAVLGRLVTSHKASPISLQIAPTSRCNLHCVFCSNRNREQHEDLDPHLLFLFIQSMKHAGLKSVEWTGGGDPTMYKDINECIRFCERLGLEQGFITNGMLIEEKIDQRCLNFLKWLRISMNCLDYTDHINIPKLNGTVLGFSYVMNERTTEGVFDRIYSHIIRYHPQYVRVVPNCQATDEEQRINNEKFKKLIAEMGEPYFYQEKVFEKPDQCYWCYFKPFLLHDGWIYPCSSIVLNNDSGEKFNEKFRWCKMDNLLYKYQNPIISYKTDNCDHCVFTTQNKMIIELIEPSGMENFV